MRFYPWSRSYLGPAYARIAEASTSFPVSPEGPDSGRRMSPLCVSDPPQGGPIGYSPPHARLEGSFHEWPWGSLDTPPRGLSHATPPRGVLRDWSRPVPGSCRGVVSPLTGGFPHKAHPTGHTRTACPPRTFTTRLVAARPAVVVVFDRGFSDTDCLVINASILLS